MESRRFIDLQTVPVEEIYGDAAYISEKPRHLLLDTPAAAIPAKDFSQDSGGKYRRLSGAALISVLAFLPASAGKGVKAGEENVRPMLGPNWEVLSLIRLISAAVLPCRGASGGGNSGDVSRRETEACF